MDSGYPTGFSGAAPGVTNTKSKLTVLQERFQGFEKQMEAESRARREGEETRFTVIRDTIMKLEKTINAEVKRRCEVNKTLQQMFEAQLTSVQDKLEEVFKHRLEALEMSVGNLNERYDKLSKEFNEERDKYSREIEEKNSHVAKDLGELQQVFEGERVARAEREAQLTKRLGDFEVRADGRFEQQRGLVEQKYHSLREELEESKRLREKGDEKFQTFVLEEIAALKNGLVMESQSRESADDDIVFALNHYTKALQDGLRIINTV